MAADFTQGKWTCNFMPEEFNVKGKGCVITANGKYVATVQKDGDARLISVAPKMYALLAMLLHSGTIQNTPKYHALDKMLEIIECVTGDRVKISEDKDESSGVSP